MRPTLVQMHSKIQGQFKKAILSRNCISRGAAISLLKDAFDFRCAEFKAGAFQGNLESALQEKSLSIWRVSDSQHGIRKPELDRVTAGERVRFVHECGYLTINNLPIVQR